MYFAQLGPWAEPDFRRLRFFPRIRPTFVGRGYGRGGRSPSRGQTWLPAGPNPPR